ncbi:MAG: AAA family ATPase [Halobacteriovoraceae bacterium]|nr:AAA family ATPase [Halobacteriovoraceae bacterium]
MDRVSFWLESFHKGHGRTQNVKTIAILSGKGGVGKTSVALRMANDLSRKGLKVLLVDCDYNLSNTLIKLNTPFKSQFLSYLNKEVNLHDCIKKFNSFHLLPTCNGNLDLFDNKYRIQAELIGIVDECEKHYDLILLDCPAGVNKETMNIAAFCDLRLVVLNPDKSSMTDAYSLLKILMQRYGAKNNKLILNKCRNEAVFENISRCFYNTCRKFLDIETEFLGQFPYFNSSIQDFDREFIFGENNSLQDNSVKIIARLFDLIYEPIELEDSSLSPVAESNDQEKSSLAKMIKSVQGVI